MLEDEGLSVVGATGSVPEALAAIPALMPDVAIVDTLLREDVWICVCRRIWDESPMVRCLTLGSLGTPAELRGAVLGGARGHALRMVRGGDLLRRVQAVAAGEDLADPGIREAVRAELGPWAPGPPLLDAPEREVLLLCAKGLSDTEIALEMGLEQHRFQMLLRSALGKYGYAAASAGAPEGQPPVPEPA
jgi:two-component system response regulator DevR